MLEHIGEILPWNTIVDKEIILELCFLNGMTKNIILQDLNTYVLGEGEYSLPSKFEKY